MADNNIAQYYTKNDGTQLSNDYAFTSLNANEKIINKNSGEKYNKNPSYTNVFDKVNDFSIKSETVKNISGNGSSTTITYQMADGTSKTFTTKDTTYSAGSNITLTGTTFSLTKNNVIGALGFTPVDSNHTHDDRYYTESEVNNLLNGKANTNHTHDDRYYTESEIDSKLGNYAGKNHTHDDRYYTESEIDSKLSGKADTNHNHNGDYVKQGGGVGQKTNTVKIGWSSESRLKCTVDSTDIGNFIFDGNVSNKNATLEWDKSVTIATIGNTDIKVKLPAEPDSSGGIYYGDSTLLYTTNSSISKGQFVSGDNLYSNSGDTGAPSGVQSGTWLIASGLSEHHQYTTTSASNNGYSSTTTKTTVYALYAKQLLG